MDWATIRRLFPATRDQAYLNTATYGPGPEPVRAAVQEAVQAWSEGRGDWLEWETSGERCRELFGRLIGAPASEVALVPAVSVAAGLVAEQLPHRPGANLVVGASEFRSNLFPWWLQERRGFQVRRVPYRRGRLPLEGLLEAVDRETVLVAVSWVQSATGYRLPLEPLIEACRRVGARLFVDGTQGVGALSLPLEGIDYLAVAGYKWLLAPRGSGYLYAPRARLQELAPLFAGWKSPADPYADYYGPPLELADRASRFDVSLAWPVWPGAEVALRLLLDLGLERIEARDLALAERFREGLGRVGLEPLFPPEESSQIVSLAVPDAEAARRALQEERVVGAVRGGLLRLSFHFFNDGEDVERALAALERAS